MSKVTNLLNIKKLTTDDYLWIQQKSENDDYWNNITHRTGTYRRAYIVIQASYLRILKLNTHSLTKGVIKLSKYESCDRHLIVKKSGNGCKRWYCDTEFYYIRFHNIWFRGRYTFYRATTSGEATSGRTNEWEVGFHWQREEGRGVVVRQVKNGEGLWIGRSMTSRYTWRRQDSLFDLTERVTDGQCRVTCQERVLILNVPIWVEDGPVKEPKTDSRPTWPVSYQTPVNGSVRTSHNNHRPTQRVKGHVESCRPVEVTKIYLGPTRRTHPFGVVLTVQSNTRTWIVHRRSEVPPLLFLPPTKRRK